MNKIFLPLVLQFSMNSFAQVYSDALGGLPLDGTTPYCHIKIILISGDVERVRMGSTPGEEFKPKTIESLSYRECRKEAADYLKKYKSVFYDINKEEIKFAKENNMLFHRPIVEMTYQPAWFE